MPTIKNEAIPLARRAIRALQEYEHPVTRAGIRQATALKFMALERLLRERAADVEERFNELVRKYGELRNPDEPDSVSVAKDSPKRPAFNREVRELNQVELEVPDRLAVLLSELRVRDENGELVEVECGRIADLGDLLIVAEEEAEAEPETNGHKPRNRLKAARR